MKAFFSIIILLFIAIACNKDKNRTPGVCYCDFANGEKQQYDLTHLSSQEQKDTCSNHNKNAGNFGGTCELE